MRIRSTVAALGLAAAGIAGTAGTAVAEGGDGTESVTGNGSSSSYGNSATNGDLSGQLGAVQGSLNDLCLGVPVKANIGSLIGLVPITVQDINVLSNPQNQQCADNSTQSKGDEPLSHIVDGVPIISGNGVGNDS
ncbi:rodlin [Streptomyces sp. HNM0574]|uniref:rodlin n=1 Tax=Streptomyces sp. HNM0574 TaxID=2714954 RepID=UPI00146B95C2|nr:rodlin [Streptomyces sp. HNM0574]NLU69654.1 RdlA protein [Streptomyces sp. HNM0574]